ncbi:MAG: hypothetical protein NTZ16_06330 [Verrucomicrobia bacterium]|nr:hypothetical protein [Verrucomicrobiota bacterium]
MANLKLTDIFSLVVETYSGEGFNFTEYSLIAWCKPEMALQFFAFNGLAYDKLNNVRHISDWETISPEILKQARQTLFTGYSSFLRGKQNAEGDGSYVFHCVGAEVTVQSGMISMPDPRPIKRSATDLKKSVLF